MLRLEVDPPRHGKFELLALGDRFFELLDRFGVVHSLERGVDELLQSIDAALVDSLLKERHVVATFLEQCLEDVLEHVFRQIGIV